MDHLLPSWAGRPGEVGSFLGFVLIIYVPASSLEPRSLLLLPRGYLDLSLWGADAPTESMLVGPGLASECSYQRKTSGGGPSWH